MYISRTLLILGASGLVLLGMTGAGVGFWLWFTGRVAATPFVHRTGAVVTNGFECANIGGDVLKEGGSAVDAALAAMFCEGVSLTMNMGLGGGFIMTIYSKETGTVEVLDAKGVAAAMASLHMYDGKPSSNSKGGLAVTVPGELKGYWEAHQRYGKLPWSRVIQPTIDLCKKGNLVTEFLGQFFQARQNYIWPSPTLREVFIDHNTNDTYTIGSRIKRPTLAKTLELISRDGVNVLYDGVLTDGFVKDIRDMGGIISKEDLRNYKPIWRSPIKTNLENGRVLYTTPLPGSGVLLTFILNILSGFLDESSIDTVTNMHRITESFKYAFAKRTELGDPAFVKGLDELVNNLTSVDYAAYVRSQIADNRTFQDPAYYGADYNMPSDRGTAHISVLAPNGDAVSVTSSINQHFGAGFMSRSTGIIPNDEMDDFSAPNIISYFGMPASPANSIEPSKRSTSSMCPSIVTDSHGNVELVTGASGGTRIPTSIAVIILRILKYGESVKEAVDALRLHHQLTPMQITYEKGYDQTILKGLRKIGHKVVQVPPSDPYAAVPSITHLKGKVEAIWDIRRTGQVCYV